MGKIRIVLDFTSISDGASVEFKLFIFNLVCFLWPLFSILWLSWLMNSKVIHEENFCRWLKRLWLQMWYQPLPKKSFLPRQASSVACLSHLCLSPKLILYVVDRIIFPNFPLPHYNRTLHSYTLPYNVTVTLRAYVNVCVCVGGVYMTISWLWVWLSDLL